MLFSKDIRRRRVNYESDNKLMFCFSPNSFKPDIDAMTNSFRKKKKIKVYYKESPDKWFDKGFYIINEFFNGVDGYNRKSMVFVLTKIQ